MNSTIRLANYKIGQKVLSVDSDRIGLVIMTYQDISNGNSMLYKILWLDTNTFEYAVKDEDIKVYRKEKLNLI